MTQFKTAKFKLGVIIGSNRKESINRKLAQAIVRLGGGAFDATIIQIDDLPMYNQDNEQPLPAPVARFKAQVAIVSGIMRFETAHIERLVRHEGALSDVCATLSPKWPMISRAVASAGLVSVSSARQSARGTGVNL